MLWIAGYISPIEGYAQAGLNYLMALKTAGFSDIDFLQLDQPFNWNQAPKWSWPLRENGSKDRGTAIIHRVPNFISKSRRGGGHFTGMTVFETDRLPYWMTQELEEVTEALIVPAKFNEAGLRMGGYTKPIHVVPHTVGDWWWKTSVPEERDRPFTFMYSGTWTVRKNVPGLLRAYRDAFPKPSPDIQLLLKTSYTLGASDMYFEEFGSREDIRFWEDTWQEKQMLWLFANTDCFVSAHHSEGWGLGPFQAKLMGKPVIYTNWSAVTEFCSKTNGDIPVDYTMTCANKAFTGLPIYDEPNGNLLWATPTHEALVEAFREMAKNADEYRRRAQAAAASLRDRYSWATVGQELLSVIRALP